MEKGKGQKESVSTSSTLNAQSFVGFARKANFPGANANARRSANATLKLELN